MNDAPETIWIEWTDADRQHPPLLTGAVIRRDPTRLSDPVEYTRTDLIQAILATARAEEREACAALVDEMVRQWGIYGKDEYAWEIRNRKDAE